MIALIGPMLRCEDCGHLTIGQPPLLDRESRFPLCDDCVAAIEQDAEAWEQVRSEDGQQPCYFLQWVNDLAARQEATAVLRKAYGVDDG